MTVVKSPLWGRPGRTNVEALPSEWGIAECGWLVSSWILSSYDLGGHNSEAKGGLRLTPKWNFWFLGHMIHRGRKIWEGNILNISPLRWILSQKDRWYLVWGGWSPISAGALPRAWLGFPIFHPAQAGGTISSFHPPSLPSSFPSFHPPSLPSILPPFLPTISSIHLLPFPSFLPPFLPSFLPSFLCFFLPLFLPSILPFTSF